MGGDLRTVALVDTAGTVDFLCWPRVDAPTAFVALLDPERGGHFALAPALGEDGRGGEVRRRPLYLPDTNVLLTRFLSEPAVAEVIDVMPAAAPGGGGPLTSAEHGAIVAAPTFGLPEVLGGAGNWDHRYTWIRDAAFTVYAFLRPGLTSEAGGFMRWIYARTIDGPQDGTLQIMYGLDGRTSLPEAELPHLAGYAGSRPVRVGNAAFDQLQLDSYGALFDAVYLANKYTQPVSYDGW